MPTIQTSCVLKTLSCLIISISSFAQPAPVDTSHSLPATRAAIFYQSYVGPDAAIYNGYAYQPRYQGLQGSPYFLTENLTEASLIYEGLSYIHIPLLYNQLLDEAIISNPAGELIALSGDRLQQFTYSGHTFIHLNKGTPAGYYEVLRSGYTSLLVRHKKKIVEKIEFGDLHHYIDAGEEYYLGKQTRYYPIDSENSLLNLLGDKKKELGQFLKAQNIRFKKDRETAMTEIIDYYNQLPH